MVATWKSARRSGRSLALLALAALWGCAEGAGSVQDPDSSTLDIADTGDGGDTSGADTTDDTAADTGDDGEDDADADTTQGELTVCVLNAQGPDGSCADPGVLDFGIVDPGTTVLRSFRLENGRSETVTVWTATIASSAFATETLTYEADGTTRTPQTLPFQIEPGAALYFEVTLSAGSSGGVLPANEVVVSVAVGAGSPESINVPMAGSLNGCFAGTADCDGDSSNGCETTTTDDVLHCGACNAACELANSDMACVDGACQFVGCAAGFADCNDSTADGCEVDTDNTTEHCGACDAACPTGNASIGCQQGECRLVDCNAGFADCNTNLADGCEQDIATSNLHCGACNSACSLDHAEAFCDTGNCTFFQCEAGYETCDGDTENGCEVHVAEDELNCGACGVACANDHGATFCNAGQCTPSCDALWGNCDNDRNNGCETALNTLDDCGGCGVVCDYPGAGESCAGGFCQLGACDGGLGNCNGNAVDGCETDILGDELHCGGCNVACIANGGTNTCVNGGCVPACNPGFADCDGNALNGCETNLNTSVGHCGMCNNVCALANADEVCILGTCEVGSCNGSNRNCDGNHPNGCETDILSDEDNCGTCGTVCALSNANEVCSSGTCQVASCNGTYRNCDGNHPNGCEINTANNTSHCGGCNNSCTVPFASSTCSSSNCSITDCSTGYCDLDGVHSTGCELDLDTDPTCSSATATYIGAVSGDTSSPNVTWTGRGERYLRVRVNENDSSFCSSENLCVEIELNPNGAAMDYDLYARCDGCDPATSSNDSSTGGSGAIDTVQLKWDEDTALGCPTGSDTGRDIYIWVRQFSVDECNQYTITVRGDVCSAPSNTCGSK